MNDTFARWRGESVSPHLGTAFGGTSSPFQNWYRFKEAFAPELVVRALRDHNKPSLCFDPFGGSGTTALVSQMLGVESHTNEVNPFLADLILAKVHQYDLDHLEDSLARWIAVSATSDSSSIARWPPTFVEPGRNSRWIFDLATAEALARLVMAAELEPDDNIKRFLKVAIAAEVIPASNVVINGKGRRYRRGWQRRSKVSADLTIRVADRARAMIKDASLFTDRFNADASVFLGDSRKLEIPNFDVSVFSPPYPNSFDYTDVYNVELWALGYLGDRIDNKVLREKTLSSHVQLQREFRATAVGSPRLDQAMEMMRAERHRLWNKNIPEMLVAYFGELTDLLRRMQGRANAGGAVHIVIGDSRYAGVHVESGKILLEISANMGWQTSSTSLRTMRHSPQQGGHHGLEETLLVLK